MPCWVCQWWWSGSTCVPVSFSFLFTLTLPPLPRAPHITSTQPLNSCTTRLGKIQSRDGEGYARNWDADGAGVLVADKNNNEDTAGMSSARWGDREWVKTVELAYWRTGADEQNGRPKEKHAWVDSVVENILEEMCRDEDGVLPSDEERSRRRLGMLRTQYRAVVSEVIGIAVKW